MPTVQKQALVPHSNEQMYQLINQVEQYPQFLPWCQSTEILSQNEETMKARVKIAKGPVKNSFTTLNQLKPNQEIAMNLVDGPFKHLHGLWKLKPLNQGCEVSFYLEFEFINRLMSMSFGPIFHHATQTLMTSFLQRAQELYGK